MRGWVNRVRPTAVLLATTFLAVVCADAFGAHACPHHDPIAAEAGEAKADTHPGHAAHNHTVAESTQASDHNGDHGGPRTCVGDCSGSLDGDGTFERGGLRWVTNDLSDAPVPAPADVIPAVRAAYLLPLANAPPV